MQLLVDIILHKDLRLSNTNPTKKGMKLGTTERQPVSSISAIYPTNEQVYKYKYVFRLKSGKDEEMFEDVKWDNQKP